ncbi:MAG TPA: hypothetical protein VIW29_05230 [Polyangiaceae bacterium]
MPNSTPTRPQDNDDIARAEHQVALRKADLKHSLRAAERSGEQLAVRLGSELKPAFIAAAAVAGAAVLTGIGVALLRRRHGRRAWLPPQQPSAFASAARGLGLFLARIAARRIAEEVTRRLAAPPLTQPGSVAPAPNQV